MIMKCSRIPSKSPAYHKKAAKDRQTKSISEHSTLRSRNTVTFYCMFAIIITFFTSFAQATPIGQFETVGVEMPYGRAMKRSMALGRLEFRPGKRSDDAMPFEQETSMVDLDRDFEAFQNWLRPTRRLPVKSPLLTMEDVESLPSTFSLLTEAQMGKRSMAVGRSGFRPGKRSIATGREGFRPGKRSANVVPYISAIYV